MEVTKTLMGLSVALVALCSLLALMGHPADAAPAPVRKKRVALNNYRKYFDIVGHRLIDEHHEYHDYGPMDYHDYHDYYDNQNDYHSLYNYFHDYGNNQHGGGGGYGQQQSSGYGQPMMNSYKPKPKIVIIKKIVPLSTTTAP